MARTENLRVYILLVLVCVLVSMNGFGLYYRAGWGITLTAIVVGLVLAIVVAILTTSLD